MKILRTLFHEAFPRMDAAVLSRETGKSRAGIHRALHEILPTGLLTPVRRGRTTYYAVDSEHPWTRPLADLFRAERTKDNVPHLFPTYWNHLESVVSQLADRQSVEFVVLYGSLTRSPIRPNADVDLFVGTHADSPRLRVDERVLDHPVSVVPMSRDRIRKELKKPSAFLENVIERHVVLYKAPSAAIPWRPSDQT